ncbi:MAG: hypothetical protein AAFU85_20135, partial [Planctomycetota bacterium]
MPNPYEPSNDAQVAAEAPPAKRQSVFLLLLGTSVAFTLLGLWLWLAGNSREDNPSVELTQRRLFSWLIGLWLLVSGLLIGVSSFAFADGTSCVLLKVELLEPFKGRVYDSAMGVRMKG